MRGTPALSLCCVFCPGIIPAYAGNTLVVDRQLEPMGDHPRVCGEHQLGGEHVDHLVGIIPAYAGNTDNRHRQRCGNGDHPRVCGEHIGIAVPAELRSGSSPRMRGTPSRRWFRHAM